MSVEILQDQPKRRELHARDYLMVDQEDDDTNLNMHALFGGIAIHAYRNGDVSTAYEASLLDEFLCEKPPIYNQ